MSKEDTNGAKLFSRQSEAYARFRPQYPANLYHYLSGLCQDHQLVWDCATGNGQAAVGLAEYFERVIATDVNKNQVSHAIHHNRVEYRVAPAENSGLEDQSIDLVTIAQAIHWFDLPRFYDEVWRVLRPGGIICCWSYYHSEIDPAVDLVVRDYADRILAGSWAPEILRIQEGYKTIPFPFTELHPPVFKMTVDWALDELIGFLFSWSGTQTFIERTGQNPLTEIYPALLHAWGEPGKKKHVTWPLSIRVGRFSG